SSRTWRPAESAAFAAAKRFCGGMQSATAGMSGRAARRSSSVAWFSTPLTPSWLLTVATRLNASLRPIEGTCWSRAILPTPTMAMSVAVTGNRLSALAREEVEVRSGVGALNMSVEEPRITALGNRHIGLPGFQACLDLRLGQVEMQAARRHVHLDHVAVPHDGERPANGGFGRRMQDHSAVCRTRHARIGDADHVGDALPEHLGRQAHIADFCHARIPFRPAVLQHHDRVLVYIERLV